MKQLRYLWIVLLVAVTLLPLSAQAQNKVPRPRRTDGLTLQNAHVKVLVFGDGSLTMGTTGGDPTISGDEDKSLLWGFSGGPQTSFPSARVIRNGTRSDFDLRDTPPSSPTAMEGGAVVTRWVADGIEITQRVSLAQNPYTNREDAVLIAYTLRNQGSESAQAGVRSLLDVMVGSNDFAPFFLPGVGRTDTEREFSSSSMPDYFKAFESDTYEENSLRAQGLLRGFGMTTPDRFVLATFLAGRGSGRGIYDTVWDYAITSGANIGDSAVGYWWGPYSLNSGQSKQVQTLYGLGGAGGGDAWFDAPAQLVCPNTQFTANLWISNTSTETLMNGSATITLPAGLQLVSGQSAAQPVGSLVPGEVRSVSWQIVAEAQREETLTYQAAITFANLSEPLREQASIRVPDCRATPTTGPTPTTGSSPTVGPSRTATPGPTPRPTPVPEVPEPGSLALLGTGLAGLAAYLWRKRR